MFGMFLFLILAYLMGSLSSAILVCRMYGLPDPRTTGSKNPGATNVLRVGGKYLAALTLLGDALKGFIPVALALYLGFNSYKVSLIILAVFLGHLYPIFFGFKGGKGVATAVGILFALSFKLGFLLLLTWGIMVGIFRISSLAALTAALVAPLYVLLLPDLRCFYMLPIFIISLFIIFRHLNNIDRIFKGIEPKIGEKKQNQ